MESPKGHPKPRNHFGGHPSTEKIPLSLLGEMTTIPEDLTDPGLHHLAKM